VHRTNALFLLRDGFDVVLDIEALVARVMTVSGGSP
jgi:hypothetical protein